MRWDHEVDVVVVGSGNGGLTAALCNYEMGSKDVLVVEKSELYGGTSSISGGGVWIPCSHYAKAAGAEDSLEQALTYLRATTPEGAADELMQRHYLEQGPEMLQFMHDRTRMRYESLGQYPDYFSDAPGARNGHRSMEPQPVAITDLHDKGATLRPTHPMMYMMNHIPISQKEAYILVGQLKGWVALGVKIVLRYMLDLPQRLRTPRSRRATCGSAGIARLALSMQDRQLPIWLNTEMTELIVENGKAVGIQANKAGKTISIKARKAVILASGGFEQNQAMRDKYLPKPTNTEWSASHKDNTGLPISKAIEQGADCKAMNGSWWCTTIKVPGETYPRLSIMEKSYPGNCVVNQQGQRIANESQNYLMYVQACFEAQQQGTPVDTLWMVFDARFRANYIVGPLMTSKLLPDFMLPKHFYSDEFLSKANSIEELATSTGIDEKGLLNTIHNMNRYAETGVDEEFNRGGFAYDRYYGDPQIKPNNCLAPIVKAPFYAVRLYLGEFGTHGGLTVSTDGQVQKNNGEAFEGLYACGNCSAPVLPTYPGPGSTLGPAMTFAYLASKHINQVD